MKTVLPKDAEFGDMRSFQERVKTWLLDTFGESIALDQTERGRRVVEEGLEMGQAVGVTKEQAHQLVEYVFSRPKGDIGQEAGGVIVTLAALLAVNPHYQLDLCAEAELARCWEKQDKIRAKQVSKELHGVGRGDVPGL